MKRLALTLAIIMATMASQAKTLIVYYSFTNNVEHIVNGVRTQIEADVIEIEPAEKGLDYAADNYAIGSALISAIRNNPDDASSYPEIDPVDVNLAKYDCVIIGSPLWWSNMAAPLQTFLFHHGKEMAGKKIGLIVSSASSGTSGVEADAKRLIPDGDFLSPSLWIRSSQTSDAAALVSDWLNAIGYENIAGIEDVMTDDIHPLDIYTLKGQPVASDISNLTKGIYIIRYVSNGKVTSRRIAI